MYKRQEQEILLGTKGGMAIHFSEGDIRAMGRVSMGVKSMDLDEGDAIVGLAVYEEGAQVLSITENGYGKRTEIDAYRLQSRGGKGIRAMNLTDKTGSLASQLIVHEDEDLMLITDDGVIIRLPVEGIPVLGRNTQGVRVMRVAEGSHVVGVTRAEKEEEVPEEPADSAGETPEGDAAENRDEEI